LSNKEIIFLVLGAFTLMLIFPWITNELMFLRDFRVAGDTNAWLGYQGSFWGAIIGGVISGAITLIGVRLTITQNNDSADKNRDLTIAMKKVEFIPRKITYLEELIKEYQTFRNEKLNSSYEVKFENKNT
jgi:hypothetical protein